MLYPKHPLTKKKELLADIAYLSHEYSEINWREMFNKVYQSETFEDLTTGHIMQINGTCDGQTDEAAGDVINVYSKYLADESKSNLLPVRRLYVDSCTFAPWKSGKDFFKHCEGKEQFNEPNRIESITAFYEDIAKFLDEPAISSLERPVSKDEQLGVVTSEIIRFILERAQGKNMNELYTIKKGGKKIYYTVADDKKANNTGKTYYFISEPKDINGKPTNGTKGILIIADTKGDNPGVRTVMKSNLRYMKKNTLMTLPTTA